MSPVVERGEQRWFHASRRPRIAGQRSVEPLEQRALAWPASRRGSSSVGVVHAEHVQHAVHDQQRDLVVVRAGVRRARSPPRPRDR